MSAPDLSHLDAQGRARMVDVGDKPATARRAVAEGVIRLSDAAFAAARDASGPKGEVIRVAELAGVMAAKRTAELIPLCHPLPLDQVTVEIAPAADGTGLKVRATASVTARTGVEMEALVAATTALLTLYDMLKAVDRAMVIEAVRLIEKAGGASGDWRRDTP